jgi:hypothetical protein
MYTYTVSKKKGIATIRDNDTVILTVKHQFSFFNTKLIFYNNKKQIVAKTTDINFLFFYSRRELLFVSLDTSVTIKRNKNSISFFYNKELYEIRHKILKGETSLFLDNIKCGNITLNFLGLDEFEHTINCQSESHGKIFSIVDMALNYQDKFS